MIVAKFSEFAHTWTAWLSGQVECGFGGDTPQRTVKRLIEATCMEPADIVPISESRTRLCLRCHDATSP